MYRRKLGLSCAGLALAAAGLAGCKTLSSFNVATVSQAVVTDLAYLKNGLSVIVGVVQALGLPVDKAVAFTDKAQTAIALISSIATGMLQSSALPIVEQIRSLLNSLLPALQTAGVALPPFINQVIQAMIVLAPAVYQAVGILTAASATPAQAENLQAARQVLSGV